MTEELASMNSWLGTTTGENIFKHIEKTNSVQSDDGKYKCMQQQVLYRKI